MTVNLLPWREARHKQKIRRLYWLFILGLIFILMGWSVLSAKSLMFLLEQKHEISKLQQHIQQLSGEYQHYLVIHKKLQQQMQTTNYIKNLLQTNQTLLQLLHDIGQKMPPNLYLTQIQKTHKSLSFSGKSASHAEITLLLKNLETQFAGNPQLTETKHTDPQNPEIDFELIYENYSAQ
ncbi:MAG TPA: PilN domain-containing protein [Gammaproteobacteria bacterium]|nr:PilN domain-containing protein [Gammaproteobacteria bacterium]